jgi:hypothetical protein
MDIFAKIFSEIDEDTLVEKTAATATESAETQTTKPEVSEGVTKLAADLDAAGRIMAEGMFNRWCEKLAMDVPASGGGIEPRSKTEAIAKKIAVLKGQQSGETGGDMSVRAEQHGAMSGAKGTVNSPAYRG